MSRAELPVILTIGGSDSAGMAGIQMDLRVIRALGGHGASAITAVTAQHSGEVLALNPVAPEVLHQQLAACRALPLEAVKIGLLASPAQVRVCADFLRASGLRAVLDPVLASSSGTPFADSHTLAAIRGDLLPLCSLVTPNRLEVAPLTGIRVDSDGDVEIAAGLLAARGAGAVVIKGGHGDGPWSKDFFHRQHRRFWLASPRRHTVDSRGTGCAFATAAAAALALGHDLDDAMVIAKMAVNQGLRQGSGWPGQPGPLAISHFPDSADDLPALLDHGADPPAQQVFPSCGPVALGLYPVVDRSHWLETLLPCGVTTIQLRIKDLAGAALRTEITRGIAVARDNNARLFVNDHWQLAIELGAYGVHLGQEDLGGADLDAIHRAGLRLGISTHCHYEVARAHRYRPSYLACGPIYPTTSKQMPWQPQGIGRLSYWRRVLNDYPLVAIGGIDDRRLAKVAATGVDGVAMISALTGAADPAATARRFITTLQDTGMGKAPIAEAAIEGTASRETVIRGANSWRET